MRRSTTTGATHRSAPLIIGHRGASVDAPENTLVAFDLALRQGADGVEFDVRLARDGVPVVVHDATLARTALCAARVCDLTSAELKRLDAVEWFNRQRWATERVEREGVPTLDETLELVGRRSRAVYVEMKCETDAEAAPLARAVIASVRRLRLESVAVVKCFRLCALEEVKRHAPEIRTAALFERTLARILPRASAIITEAVACRADEISLHHSLLNRAVVEAARGRGLATLVWTVDTPSLLGRALDLGVRAVFTNRPASLRSALSAPARDLEP